MFVDAVGNSNTIMCTIDTGLVAVSPCRLDNSPRINPLNKATALQSVQSECFKVVQAYLKPMKILQFSFPLNLSTGFACLFLGCLMSQRHAKDISGMKLL